MARRYIDKDALMAEIEKRLDKLYDLLPDASKVENGSITISEACNTGKYTALESFKKYIDNLEVRKVDLEKELDEWMKYGPHTNYPWCTIPDAIKITAEHFFELGLKAQKGE